MTFSKAVQTESHWNVLDFGKTVTYLLKAERRFDIRSLYERKEDHNIHIAIFYS